MKWIEEVSIKLPSGDNASLKKPNRHHHIIHMLADLGHKTPIKGTQGFIYNGKFVDRKTAAKIALKIGQIEKLNWPPNLYSEDLW